MKRFGIYTRLEIKKSVKLLPKLLIGTVLLLITVTVMAMAANDILGDNTDSEKGQDNKAFIDIGVVCKDDSWIMELAKGMLLGNKKIASVVNLKFTDYDDGMKGLEENVYMAVVIIPENAVDDIISGENTPFQVIFPKNAGYEAAAIREVADSAVKLLASAQAGIYSAYDFYGEYNHKWKRAGAIKRLNERYIDAVLGLEDFFKDTTVVATGDLDIPEYYALSGIILFIMLFGMNSLAYMEDYKKEIIAALEQNGVSIAKQTFSKFLGILCVYGIVCIVTVTGAGMAAGLKGGMTVKLLLGMIPVLFTASAMVLLVRSAVSYKPAAIMIMFLVSVFQAFVTGGFIPQMMLPKVIETIGKCTPAYYMLRELSIIYLEGSGIIINTIILLVITVALLVLAAFSQRVRRKA